MYYILTPSQYDDAGYRDAYVTGLARLLDALPATDSAGARLIFVSSTGVYGQDAGEWVDETSPTNPARFSGRRLLEGERLAASHRGGHVVVRFAGIYGAGRDALIRRVRAGKPCAHHPARYTNRIHEADCVAILRHLGQLPAPADTYIGSDSAPCTQCEVMDWLAGQLGCPRPPRATGASAGRRCRNARLLASGYTLLYPDYRRGYSGALSRTSVPSAGSSEP